MKIAIAAALIGSVALAACTPYGNARTVRETKTGGEIALEGQREIAQQKADAAMAAKCPSGFEVDEQGEAVVGSSSDSQTQAKRATLFSAPGSNTQTQSRDVTEWRIKYHCKGAEEQPAEKAAPTEEAKPQQGREQHTLILRF